MTVVTKLSVQNTRSHKSFVTKLSPTTTIITGHNGSGKTSLLEAIYIALQGSSFRGSDRDILRTNAPWWRIDIVLVDKSKRSVTYNSEKQERKKQFTIHDQISYRLSPKNKYPVVLFEPEDLRLLHGSPTRRRLFIDRLISQLDPFYYTALRKYERALKQRNNLLKKQNTNADELFVWNVALSEHGAYVIEKRILFIEQINSKLNDIYTTIAGVNDIVSVHYSHTFIGDIKQKLLTELHTNIQKDTINGNTSTGPHRHDIIFMFNNSPALSSVSRGEARTIILALKFLEVEIIEQLTDKKPIILLDDVFSELDEARQKILSTMIRDNQIIITSTHILSTDEHYLHIEL